MKSQYSECVACSGKLSRPTEFFESILETCIVCGGLHYTASPKEYRRLYRSVVIVDMGEGNEFDYFDVSATDGSGRFHGWMKRRGGFRQVVQIG